MISEEKVISIISEALDLKDGSITIDTKSSDIPDWDSLGHLSILSKISEVLGDSFNESQELAAASSVKEIFDCLNKK